jgi:hypothetical protein
MKRLHVYIPDTYKAELAKIAKKHETSEANLVRTAIANHIAKYSPLEDKPVLYL